MSEDTISVIVPTFNRARTLPAAIRSVLAQTLPADEVIVVDDGSEDETPEILETYGPPVVVIRQSNQGPAIARNTGLARATGRWTAFLDSDDEWYPFKLELQLKIMKALPTIGALLTDMDGVGEGGRSAKMISRVFDDFDRRYGLGKSAFFPYAATLRELGVTHHHVDPDTRVYYGPIAQHLWVKPFIVPNILAASESLGRFSEGRGWSDADFFIRLAQRRWIGYLDLPTICYGQWRPEQRLSGATYEAERYQYIVSAHQTYYGRGEALRPDHRRYYRRQRAYYFHRIAVELLGRGRRRQAAMYALRSLGERPWQQAAYAALALTCAPRTLRAKILKRYFRVALPESPTFRSVLDGASSS